MNIIMKKIKKYVRKEIIFQNIQNNKKQAEIALEILLRTGFLQIPQFINLKNEIQKQINEIFKKEHLINK